MLWEGTEADTALVFCLLSAGLGVCSSLPGETPGRAGLSSLLSVLVEMERVSDLRVINLACPAQDSYAVPRESLYLRLYQEGKSDVCSFPSSGLFLA